MVRGQALQGERTSLTQAGLSPQHLTVLVGVYYDGETQQQIAVRLGVQQPRVSKILTEALAKLRVAGVPAPRERPKHRLRYFDPSELDKFVD